MRNRHLQRLAAQERLELPHVCLLRGLAAISSQCQIGLYLFLNDSRTAGGLEAVAERAIWAKCAAEKQVQHRADNHDGPACPQEWADIGVFQFFDLAAGIVMKSGPPWFLPVGGSRLRGGCRILCHKYVLLIVRP